eukprot:6476896-Amphidinium_carterae.1
MSRLEDSKGKIGAQAFDELQTNLGWNWIEGSLVQNKKLAPILDIPGQVMYDYMHVLYVGGVFNIHIAAMMQSLKPHHLTYATLHEYISVWTWPSKVGTNTGKDACIAKKATSHWKKQTFNAQASECRSLYPVLANWVQNVLLEDGTPNELKRIGRNFLDLVLVLELVEVSAKGVAETPGMASPVKLQHAVERYLQGFKDIYGEQWMVPKFHYMLHMPLFLQRWHCLPNCFALERKHKEPKRWAQDLANTSKNYEASVLRELTCKHISVLVAAESKHFHRTACLLDPRAPPTRLLTVLQQHLGHQQFLVANHARMNKWEKCKIGDLLWLELEGKWQVGKVQMLFSATDQNLVELLGVGLQLWQLISCAQRSSKWRCQGDVLLCHLEACQQSLIYSMSGDVAHVLLPYQLRERLQQ